LCFCWFSLCFGPATSASLYTDANSLPTR